MARNTGSGGSSADKDKGPSSSRGQGSSRGRGRARRSPAPDAPEAQGNGTGQGNKGESIDEGMSASALLRSLWTPDVMKALRDHADKVKSIKADREHLNASKKESVEALVMRGLHRKGIEAGIRCIEQMEEVERESFIISMILVLEAHKSQMELGLFTTIEELRAGTPDPSLH